MIRLMLLAVTAAALGGVLAFELWDAPEDDGPAPARTTAAAVPAPAPSDPAAAGRQEWVAAVLARPLFTPTRRPAPPEPKPEPAEAAASGLPRVAGIIFHPGRKSVIFASDDPGKPIVVGEGSRFGAYSIEAIERGHVRVSGPDGTHVLRPSFDPNAPSASR